MGPNENHEQTLVKGRVLGASQRRTKKTETKKSCGNLHDNVLLVIWEARHTFERVVAFVLRCEIEI